MGIIQRPRHTDTDWLAKGPIGRYVDAFKQHLTERGYAAHTFASYVVDITHFARWARTKRLRLNRVDEASIAEFLDDHLPNCQCAAPVRHDRGDHRAALGHLLVVLRSLGAIPPATLSATAVDEELRCYDEYMEHARGLAPKTRSVALRIIGRLLTSRFGSDAIDMAAIKPEQVRRFAKEAVRYSKPASLACVVASLRGYFRYHVSLGNRVHGGLIGALSYPANWQQSSLPKTLTTEEVERLVGSLGQPGRSMRRADAIVRCALDLGLRSGEVARLGLDDIDWRAGTVTLRHTKGCRDDLLPLPAATGKAIAAYLKHERPRTTNRAVFVRHIAPRDEPVGPDLVRKTIRQAYARAGLPYTRSHLLRHRSLNTTMIYAKLDSRNLAAVALPWPGSAA